MTAELEALELAKAAAQAAASVKAIDIKALDVTERLALTDVFVLASGHSERQVTAIVDHIEERVLALGLKPRREGRGGARWVLLDFGPVVVHVFHADDRDYYGLERLWKDCPPVDVTEALRDGAAEAAEVAELDLGADPALAAVGD